MNDLSDPEMVLQLERLTARLDHLEGRPAPVAARALAEHIAADIERARRNTDVLLELVVFAAAGYLIWRGVQVIGAVTLAMRE